MLLRVLISNVIAQIYLLKSWIGLDGHVVLIKQQLTATSHHGRFFSKITTKAQVLHPFDDVKVTEKLLVGGVPLVRRAFLSA